MKILCNVSTKICTMILFIDVQNLNIHSNFSVIPHYDFATLYNGLYFLISGGGAGGFSGAGGRPGAGSEIPILRYENNNNIDTYNYLYETGNGINAQEEGDARGDGTQAQGKQL